MQLGEAATLTGTGSENYTPTQPTLTGTISGIKADPGITVITVGNPNSFDLILDTGTLLANNDPATSLNGNGKITVNSGATLGGTGRVGEVEVKAGGNLAPGASVESLAAADTLWNGGGIYIWEINNVVSNSVADGWDFLDFTGNLTFTGTATKSTLRVISLAGAVPGAAAGFDRDTAYAWPIAAVTGAIIGFTDEVFDVDASGFQNDTGGYGRFYVETRNENMELWLVYVQQPHIATQPTDQMGKEWGHNSATFTLVAAGTGELHYQWYYRATLSGTATAVTGATASSLAYNPVLPAYAGFYHCVVSSAYGSQASAEVQLEVVDTTPPVISATTATQSQPYIGAVDVKNGAASTVQGTVNFTVAASDAASGLDGPPGLVLSQGVTTVAATYVNESPAGTFHYTWTVTAGTAAGAWTATFTATDHSGNPQTAGFTLTVDTVQVTGQVELEGFLGTGTTPTHTRVVTFVATGGSSSKTWSVALANASGATFDYTLTGVPSGTTHVSAKTAWSLRRKLAVTLVGGQGEVLFAGSNKLLGGDFDGSNFVNLNDFTVFKNCYGRNVLTEPAAAQGSIRGATYVNLDDYDLFKRNYGQGGNPQ